MTENKFTEELKLIFEYIQSTLLKEYDCDKISPEYFILSILENDNSVGYKVLSKIMLHDAIESTKVYYYKWLSMNAKSNGLTKQYDEIFERSVNEARNLCNKHKTKMINSGHILSSIIANDANINRYFKMLGVTENQINSQVIEETNNIIEEEKAKKDFEIVNSTPKKHNKKAKRGISEATFNVNNDFNNVFRIEGECGRITKNLNEEARKMRIEKIYGNEKIYTQMFNILSKRNRNNVVLVGKSGVGKTETVRNLANLIISGDVPKCFEDKILLEVDFNSLFSGTQMRGAFEGKLKSIISEIRQNGNYIFFIDSLQSALNSSFSQVEVDDFVEALMKERNAMLICTCSEKSYSKEIGDFPSWERYFEKIVLEEPNDLDCKNILKLHASRLEVFHDIEYGENVFETCIKYSKRYITERNLPDSAIDILDKAGAKKSLINFENKEMSEKRAEIKKIKNEIINLKDSYDEKRINEYDELLKKEIELNTSLSILTKDYNLNKKRLVVDVNDIKECISEKTGIDVTDLTIDDKEKLKELNERVKNVVIGQDEAVDAVCRAIKRQRVGIGNPNKPVVFLMAGSTGVGKSYLAKVIAKEMFGDEKKIVRVDCGEYSDGTSVNKIIGASPGYIGYDKHNGLTEQIKNKKHCVLLLDEIEKAHETVHDTFLTLFDEGRLTDNKGVAVDFTNVIIMMTSNVGARELDERGNGIGFVTNEESIKKEIIEKELKRKFKPEFINRIDKIVYFNKLNDENIKAIISLETDKLRKRLENIGYGLDENIDKSKIFADIFNNVSKNKKMGARPILREIQTQLEDKITDYIIENQVESGYVFKVDDIYR